MSESTQPVSADELALAIDQQSTAFERERARRAKAAESKQVKRERRRDRQFWFLLIALTVFSVLLAYRTETNNNLLREQAAATDERFYQACQLRVERQTDGNERRELFIQKIVEAAVPPKTEPEKAVLIAQLRDGLLLPVEDCGEPPTSD